MIEPRLIAFVNIRRLALPTLDTNNLRIALKHERAAAFAQLSGQHYTRGCRECQVCVNKDAVGGHLGHPFQPCRIGHIRLFDVATLTTWDHIGECVQAPTRQWFFVVKMANRWEKINATIGTMGELLE